MSHCGPIRRPQRPPAAHPSPRPACRRRGTTRPPLPSGRGYREYLSRSPRGGRAEASGNSRLEALRAEGAVLPGRDGYIAGVPCWIDSTQPDPDTAATFYAGLFGWEFENAMPAGEPAKYLVARIRGGDVAAISSQWEGAPPEAVWNTYIWVDDADESAAKAREAGGGTVSGPVDVAEAGRMAVLADPEGAVFSVWQAREHKGARVVNEHGALNFNILKTGDLETAKRFYGAVFGWTTLDLGSGQFWAMSTYGDYLEARTPGTRAQAAEFGAAGFENVVAA